MSDHSSQPEATESQILADYLPKLIRLAEKNMSARLQVNVGPEDVVQTALRTVIRRVQAGMINIEQSEDFWRLLVTITLCKVRKKARYHAAAKRSMQRQQALDVDPIDYRALVADDPSQDEADEFTELLVRLEEQLDQRGRTVLNAKLEQKSHNEIAAELGVSTKTVARELKKISEMIRSMADE